MSVEEKTPDTVEIAELEEIESKLSDLDRIERAVDSAYTTGKADRAAITRAAQLDAAEAVAMVGIAMEADEEADEAMKIAVIAEKSGDREKAKIARKKERETRKKANAEHAAATKSARQAYDAIKFSASNKMGFMRVVQVLFAIHIGTVLVWLMLTNRDAMVYNVSTIMDWVIITLEAVCFWFFINRYRVARLLVIITMVLALLTQAAVDIALGHFDPFMLLFNGAFYIFLIIYFACSKRVKYTLVNDFSKHEGDYEKDDFTIDRRGWPFIRNLIMYFIIFSIVGHWMELFMCQFIVLGLVQGDVDYGNTMLWRDWLYPFPMEGAAVVIIALVLYPFFLWLKKKFTGKKRWVAYLISFLAGALLCSVIEFSMGLLVNADLQLWDYRENFCNIMGQVCLQNTMAFGVVAAIITWWVYPLMERGIAKVPRDKMNIVFICISILGAIVWSLYIVDPFGSTGNDPEAAAKAQLAQQKKQDRAELASGVLDLVISEEDFATSIREANTLSDEEKEDLLDDVDGLIERTNEIEKKIVERTE